MAADIILGKHRNGSRQNDNLKVSFGDNADYWYLWSGMIKEIENETGELIDLYADAEFAGENLKKLESVIAKTISQLESKIESEWNVHVGTEFGIEKKELFQALNKKELIKKLKTLIMMIEVAGKTNDTIISIGD